VQTALRVKGIAFRGVLDSLERLHPGATGKMLSRLDEDTAEAVRHDRFLTSGWYPVEQYKQVYTAAMQAVGRGPELGRELGRDATLNDFRGIYRLFTLVLSPEFLMKRAPPIFNRYYDTGKLELKTVQRGLAEARYSGCPGFDRLLWEDVIGGTIAILEVAGAREVRVECLEGGGDHDAECALRVRWT
jgi:hypothetical protein